MEAELFLWRNTGGTFRMPGRIIKSGQTFSAYPHEIPQAFRNALIQIPDAVEKVKPAVLEVVPEAPKKKRLQILAIATVYNEIKYLPQMVRYWKSQGVDMYYIDNYSNDGTWEWLQQHKIPSHRFDTDGAFDLTLLQAELERTLHLLQPHWFIYASADLYYGFNSPVRDIIENLPKAVNQIKMPCWSVHNTGECRDTNFFGTYYHCSVRNKDITMISRYCKDLKLRGDDVFLPGANPIRVPGLILNFGPTKSKKEREETLARRKVAWQRGLNKTYGSHYLEGVKHKWKWNQAELLDIRMTPEFRYYENMRYAVAGVQDPRIKVTVLSKKDYAGSGWRIVQDIRLNYGNSYNIDEIVQDGRVAFGVPCGSTVAELGEQYVQQRINQSDIILFKGDWPCLHHWEEFPIPADKKTIQLVSGSHFRQMRPNLQRNVALEHFTPNDYKADFYAATTPDLCYTEKWHHMAFSWMKFEYSWKPGKKFKVIHIPSTPKKKGSETISAAMRLVCAGRNDVEYYEQTGVPYKEMMEIKKGAHLYIDQLIIDAYSNAAVEAMGYGVPVLSAIDNNLYDADCPVISPANNTPEEIADTINHWLDWERLQELSLKTFEYGKRLHGSMAEKWVEVFEQLKPTVKHTSRVGVLTPTSDPGRKPFLDFLEGRIKRQTRQPDMVLKVDYPNTSRVPDLAKRYREGCAELFKAGMDLVVFMEDDDYYPLNYLEEIVTKWEQAGRPAVIGQNRTRYYHILERKYKVYEDLPHCSAHCTAVSPKANLRCCADDFISFDIELWKANKKSVKVEIKPFMVSIKHGLGMTAGRRHSTRVKFMPDANLEVLKKWVDDEALNFYKTIMTNG